MSSSPAEPTVVNTELGIRRNGRALIGWMTETEGASWLAGREMRPKPEPDDLARVRGAIRAVARREAGLDQREVSQVLPAELNAHIESLRASPASAGFFSEGFDVALVDLTKICALQPHVCTDSIADRMATIDVTSLQSLAELTLPLPSTSGLPIQFDSSKKAWIMSSPNPNLRIMGQVQVQLDGGVPGLGFTVGIGTSFLQVAQFQGRYVLRDGYHRASGLLALGVTWAPAFVREFQSSAELNLPPGLFGQEVWLGDRPPLLTDYQNNDVACAVKVPVTQKMIIIQALEVNTLA